MRRLEDGILIELADDLREDIGVDLVDFLLVFPFGHDAVLKERRDRARVPGGDCVPQFPRSGPGPTRGPPPTTA